MRKHALAEAAVLLAATSSPKYVYARSGGFLPGPV
jgi:hypothetical protein